MNETIQICFEIMTVSFVLMALMGPKVIPVLHRMKFGQEVRDDGPESHLKKKGTPTMGGVMILCAVMLSTIIGWAAAGEVNTESLMILLLTFGFGLAGFLDDYLKIRRHNSKGLRAWQKLLIQLMVSLLFIIWVYSTKNDGGFMKIVIPFTGCGGNARTLSMPLWLYICFSLFVILGTDNGVNFTDGLDGLCSSVTAVSALFFLISGLFLSRGTSFVSAAMIGGLMGFLLFNSYPAKVFMGDTGSLAIGGFVAACASVTGSELYILIFGFIYLAEVISVIIQVGYFKITHGKRFFKMAPVHHHFELCGNSETRIVTAFTVVTAVLTDLSVMGFLFIG